MNKKTTERYIRACDRKRRFASEEDALAAIAEYEERNGPQGRLNVYACRFCFGLHVGKKSARKKKR